MLELNGKVTHFPNPQANINLPYSDELKDIISIAKAEEAIRDIKTWPNYAETPLHCMMSLADTANVSSIWYKDESQRFGLKSFKALGGAFAVARQLQKSIETGIGVKPTIKDLLDGKYQSEVTNIVITCATDGNHGRSVAWGAQMFGCGCIIYIHSDVTEGRKQAIENFGATVVRIEGNYDTSVRRADKDAKANGRIVVSDTSYEGYMEIPKDVALGYTVMFSEIVEQLNGVVPTHVFVQSGVGGLASAACGYFWELWYMQRPRMIIVEPEHANCLQLSAQAGKPTVVEGDHKTLMAGLACGEVSALAWQILATGANDFMTLSEDAISDTMKLLASGYQLDPAIEAGESAVPGLAAALIARKSEELSTNLGLNENSKILIIGTEGATDPVVYKQLVA